MLAITAMSTCGVLSVAWWLAAAIYFTKQARVGQPAFAVGRVVAAQRGLATLDDANASLGGTQHEQRAA